ncbi:MAG: sodium:alanine symporter family protein [candidate division Zixibacteria bacterium HGW-Zixibacteria-1]|nr:MAG: sodium:alanine symporter family protein [candidate division Zixibacteria bacterium HGW-Zixibacteria-1]
MDQLLNILDKIDNAVWGLPLILILVGTGVLLTVRNYLVQIRGFKHGIELISGKYDKPEYKGEISHFQALSAALSATIGTGNIAGVATAIAVGGPGALFWMWVTAAFGMAVKFTSCTLAVMYRRIDPDGYVRGGPMYFIELGMGTNWRFLAYMFAGFTAVAALGIGNMVQANSVADGLVNLIGYKGTATGQLFRLGVGVVIAAAVGMVIVGGIKRIGKVASRLVPFMVIVYIGSALIVLVMSYEMILPALKLIITEAFTPTSEIGGFAGSTVWLTMQQGFRRGVFSNESGLGSAPMAHAAAKVNEPVREGLVAMLGPFIDTLVICTMTGLVIVVSGQWMSGLDGTPLTAESFEILLPSWGKSMVSLGLILFAFSTIISWSYYGEKGIEYILGRKSALPYKWVYLIFLPIGASLQLKIVWTFADIANGLMALPNLIALVALSGVVAAATKKYFRELRAGKQRD